MITNDVHLLPNDYNFTFSSHRKLTHSCERLRQTYNKPHAMRQFYIL